jgi:aminoglycoside phosphotransferase family enzyme
MDLDYHGLPVLSEFFISRFIERSGDAGLPEVLDFYKCYRAYVRGKVSLLAAVDPTMGKGAAETALHTAGRYFQLAEEYAGKL